MALKININVNDIARQLKNFSKELEDDVKKGVKRLAVSTHLHVLEKAKSELKPATANKFNKSVGFENPAEGIWVVSIDKSGLWIEEGIPQGFDMKPGLLNENNDSGAKGKVKNGKNGKYRVIPFDKTNKSDAASNPEEIELKKTVKDLLQTRGVPFKKLEMGADGKPISGKVGEPVKLHSFNFGGKIPGKGNTPILNGLTVYQTKTAGGNVRRDILTFRTVSEGPGSAGKWIHPGRTAKKFLDEAEQWAENEWTNNILPEILGKYE